MNNLVTLIKEYVSQVDENYTLLRARDGFRYTTKIKSTVTEAKMIKDACGQYAEVSTSKVWDDCDDCETCFVYIKTLKKNLSGIVNEYKLEQNKLRKAQSTKPKAQKRSTPRQSYLQYQALLWLQ